MRAMKLTVGIPTYNRCVEIGQALSCVLPQVLPYEYVDVLVVDNASTDQTSNVVQSYQEKYREKITYLRNATNIGFSANVDMVVKSARGEFVLILSDDDALAPDSVKYVLDLLSKYRFVALFLGVETWNSDLSAPLVSASPLSSVDGCLFASGEEYVTHTKAFPPGCISGYVVDKNAWIQANALDFRDTLVVQVLTLLRMAKESPVYASYVPSVRFRAENENGDASFYQTPLRLLRHRLEPLEYLTKVSEGYSRKVIRLLKRNVMRTLIYCLVAEDKSQSVNFRELEKRILVANGGVDVYTLIISFLIRMPRPAIQLGRVLIRMWKVFRNR